MKQKLYSKKILFKLFLLLAIFFIQITHAEEKRLDPTLEQKATVVLRVKLISEEGAEKYAFYKVKVLAIYKNTKNLNISNPLIIAAYSWKPGVPNGESTVYLEQYGEPLDNQLRLLNGDATTGVSQTQQ